MISQGYSVSAGYAMMRHGDDIKEVFNTSERNMYQDKKKYYGNSCRDRRSKCIE